MKGEFSHLQKIIRGKQEQELARRRALASPFDISVVCAEDALPSLKNEVLQEGVEL